MQHELGTLAMLREAFDAFDSGRFEQAQELYVKCLQRIRGGQSAEHAQALSGLAYSGVMRGEFDGARRLYQELQSLAELQGDKLQEAVAIHQLGVIERMAGNYHVALSLFILEHDQRTRCLPDDLPGFSANSYEKGYVYLLMGRHSEAEYHMCRSLFFAQGAGDPICLGCAYRGLGEIVATEGNRSGAVECFRNSINFFRRAAAGAAAREVEVLIRKLGDVQAGLTTRSESSSHIGIKPRMCWRRYVSREQ